MEQETRNNNNKWNMKQKQQQQIDWLSVETIRKQETIKKILESINKKPLEETNERRNNKHNKQMKQKTRSTN